MGAEATTSLRSPSTHRFSAAIAAFLLFGPSIALALGARGVPMENRPAVEFSGLRAGWGSFSEFGRYVNDRLPLRSSAIHIDGWIDEEVFNEDRAFGGGARPRVVRGNDGYLLVGDSIYRACDPAAPPTETADHLRRLASAIDGSGRQTLVMVAPDKTTIMPDLLPSTFSQRNCLNTYIDDLWSALGRATIPGFVDLRAALRGAQESTGDSMYLREDSHWNDLGALVAINSAVERFAPGIWRPNEVIDEGDVEYTGDLTYYMGDPRVDHTEQYRVHRAGITQVSVEALDDSEDGINKRYVNSGPPGRLVEGRTLMVLDSFGVVALPNIVPFFEDLTVVHFNSFDPDRFVDLLADSDQVWLLCAERDLATRLKVSIGADTFLDLLGTSLPPIGSR